MTKYHINPQTGNPNICRAEAGKCPFGASEPHFNTKAEALRAYENRNATFGQRLNDGDILYGVSDYRLAPPTTVVEFDNGVRFVKTNADEWQTSQEGGLVLTDDDIFEYATQASKGSARGRIVVEGARPKGKPPIKPELFQQSAFEAGNQARKYFLLLNHRDPEMIRAYDGKVKDQAVIESIKKFNNLEDEVARLEKSQAVAISRRDNARTDKQREAYADLVRRDAEKLSAANAELEAQRIELDKHMKRYAKQHVIHRRSLDTLERMADKGVRYRPPGYENRVATLENLVKNRESTKDLYEMAKNGDGIAKVEAAKKLGIPAYITAAEEQHRKDSELRKLDATIRQLEETKRNAPTEKIRNAAQEDILEKATEREALKSASPWATKRMELFLDDLRDRAQMDELLSRELKVLKRLGGEA